MANTLRFKRGLVATIPTALAGEPLFTTDTFDLYIGNGTTNTRFQKYIASGSTSQLLRGDGSLLTMPIVLTSPSNGQVLKFNGTNWVNDSDAGVTGSGTTNYLPKWTSGTALGNSLVFDDGTGIGIGTTTIQALVAGSRTLEVSQAGDNFPAINISRTSGISYTNVTWRMFLASNANLHFRQNSTDRLILDASGNLGLGVVPSPWRSIFTAFQVGYTGALYSLTTSNATEQVNLASNYYQNSAGNELRIQAGFATRYQQGSGEHRWSTAGNSTAGSGISFTQAMTLNASGRLLLGTTSDGGQRLQVNGTARITSSLQTDTLGVDNSATIGGPFRINSHLQILNKSQTAYISFATRNTTGSEVVYDLSNVGNIVASSSVTAVDFIGNLEASNIRVNQTLSTSSSGASGNFLTINVNGTLYKLQLLNA